MVLKDQPVKIVVIEGSVRPNNFTSKAVALIVDELKNSRNIQIEVIDPNEFNLSLPGKDGDHHSAEILQKIVASATGVILATPEYHGSYSSVIKLIIDHLGYPSALAGKPVALLGVAAGKIGAIKALEHLRSVCAHVGSIVLPHSISVALVHQIFDDKGKCLDAKVEKEIRSVAVELLQCVHTHVYPNKGYEEIIRDN
jgi:FMN reductase